MKKLDTVRVTKPSCCCGHDRGTECQIVDEHKNGSVALFLCYNSTTKTALWHCASCLSLVESYVEVRKDDC